MDSSSDSESEHDENISAAYNENADGSTKLSRPLQIPEVGMLFMSEEAAFAFYNRYAKNEGFSVRKNQLRKRVDGTVQRRVFCCNKEGTRAIHPMHVTKKPRAMERTNCNAKIQFHVDQNNVWTVKKFEAQHNHPLASPNKTHLLRSHRKISDAQRVLMDEFDKAGICPSQAFEFFQVEAKDAANVGYTPVDHYNHLRNTRMRNLQIGDAQHLLEILKDMQNVDPSFFYAMQLDDKGQIANFFWADGRSRLDYSYFGDVVSFDTTFQTNKYELPFAPILGINHHKQTVVFGAALLLDETTESFIWLFQTFLTAMYGIQPKTIFTDQCAAMIKAISIVLPNSCHRLCLWHLFQNAAKHLSNVYNAYSDFQCEFKKCIYEGGTVDDFEKRWEQLLNTYNLADNSWLKDMYANREKWALVFRRESFCATMTTTQRSENMNRHFKKYFNRKLSLTKFVESYHMALVKFRRKELLEDYKSRQTKPLLYSYDMPMLKEASDFYTRIMYNDFEEEFRASLPCYCEAVSAEALVHRFKVTTPKQKVEFVEFHPNDDSVKCSCMKFESMGILCMHGLRVLNHNNRMHIPKQFLLKRWSKLARDGMASNIHPRIMEENGKETVASRYSRLCNKAVRIAIKCADSEQGGNMLEAELDKLNEKMDLLLRGVIQEEKTSDHTDNVVVQTNTDNSNYHITVKAPPMKEKGNRKYQQKGRLKGALEKRRKRGDGSSRKITTSRTGVSKTPEQDMTHHYQIVDDHGIASQDSNISSFLPPNPMMQGQSSSLINWNTQSYHVPYAQILQCHENSPLMHYFLDTPINQTYFGGIPVMQSPQSQPNVERTGFESCTGSSMVNKNVDFNQEKS